MSLEKDCETIYNALNGIGGFVGCGIGKDHLGKDIVIVYTSNKKCISGIDNIMKANFPSINYNIIKSGKFYTC